jgi:predicted N-acetyltransferase YhbS
VIRIREMTSADIVLGMRLKNQAGWNQVEADWLRFLSMQPDGCFVAEWNGTPVGTAVTCIFGEVAWLAMVLVDVAWRGRGIGAALVQHALNFLDKAGVRSVRIDATSLGQPLYAKLDFIPEYELRRYTGVLPAQGDTSSPHSSTRVSAANATDYEPVCQLDRAVTATDRRKFLLRLFSEFPHDLRVIKQSDELTGYVAIRPGSDALQIGPCVAAQNDGAELLADAANRFAGRRVFIDLPSGNSPAVRFAQSMQLHMQRTFIRMRRGSAVNDDITRLWASSGPELG